MSSSTNNGAFGWGDDRKLSVHASSQQDGNFPHVELHQHHSYVPTGFSSNSSSWSNVAFLDSSYPTRWAGDLRIDGTRPGPSFGAPRGNVDVQGTCSLLGMEVAAPITEQAFPIVQRALPARQPCPQPSPIWARAPRPAWQPAPSLGHPVHTARQPGGHSGSISSLGVGLEASCLQFAVPFVKPAHSGHGVIPTDHSPSMGTPHSVQPSTQGDPVLAVTSGRRGERLNLASDTNTFQCLWRSGGTRCRALITGDRKSVSSHLRDEHGFMCDGQTTACAWGQCSTWMQRRNIPRHIIACHLEIKVNCPHCGIALSRQDAKKKHRLACQGVVKAPLAAVVEGRGEDDGRLFF